MTIKNLFARCSLLSPNIDRVKVIIHRMDGKEFVQETMTIRDASFTEWFCKEVDVFNINDMYELEVWFW